MLCVNEEGVKGGHLYSRLEFHCSIDCRTVQVSSHSDGLSLFEVHDPAIEILPLCIGALEGTFKLHAHFANASVVLLVHNDIDCVK
jgi:hypothetical protein